jgi:multidrug resistance protein, MATE family
MTSLELAGVELMQPLAGLISSESNAAQAAVLNIYIGYFTVYISISIATSILVGGCVGSENIEQAKRFARTSIYLILSLSAVLICITLFFDEFIISLYTSEANVIVLALAAMAAFSLALIPDSIIFS